nr:actin gamma 1 propeptide [Hymenolepis microstoma]
MGKCNAELTCRDSLGLVLPMLVSRPRQQNILVGMKTGVIMLVKRLSQLEIFKSPNGHDTVNNWDDVEKICHISSLMKSVLSLKDA